MHHRSWAVALACCLPTFALADGSGDLFKFIPKQADAVLIVESPRRLVDAVMTFQPLRQLASFDAVKEQLASTNGRKLANLIAYYEKALGHPWPELLDKLAGGGATLAIHFDGDKSPALLLVKAKDEALLKRALELIREVAAQELERVEAPLKVQQSTHRGFEGHQLGKDIYAALAGSMLIVSNRSDGLKAALDLYIDGSQESLARDGHPAAARKLLGSQPVAWLYGNLNRLHENKEAKQAYEYPKGDPFNLIVAQGMTDVLGKSPFVAAGLFRTDDGMTTTIRMPAGRDATPEGLGLHLPPADQPGSLPLLEPKNVLFSASFCLDLSKLVTERQRLFNDRFRTEFEKGEKQLGRFLGGRKLADLLTSVGPYHRVVVAAQEKAGYEIQPDQMQPNFALVSDLRSPGYADSMNAILRTAALFAGATVKLKMSEETIGDVKLVCYRFPVTAKVDGDLGKTRFNFSPCFAKVGNQFLVASTAEFGRELVGLLQKPEVSDPKRGSPKTTQMRAYAEGGVSMLKLFEEQLITQTILEQAASVDEARRQAALFVNWIRDLGRIEMDIDYGPNDFRFDIRHRVK